MGEWFLDSPSSERSEAQINVTSYLSTLSISKTKDGHKWWPDDNRRFLKYATGQIYNLLKDHDQVVIWHKKVWFSGEIPGHKFMTWLMVLNRCITGDRILHWGIPTDPHCLLCNVRNKSQSHIFFECNYSWTIWKELARKCNLSFFQNREFSLEQL